MDVRRIVTAVVALVLGVLVLVLLGALGEPVAWAVVALVAVVVVVVAIVVRLPRLAARALILVGVLVAVGSLVVAVVDGLGRGFRTDTSSAVIVVGAAVGVLLVVAGLFLPARNPLPSAPGAAAAAVTAVGFLVAILVVLAVPFLPQMRAVAFTQADPATDLVLGTPTELEEGDLLVAQVFHSTAAPLRAPAGWTSLTTTAVDPARTQTVELFVHTATDDEPDSVTFSTAAPDGKIGGISAWSHAGTPVVLAQQTGTGTPLAAPALEAGSSSSAVLSFSATSGAVALTAPPERDELWQTSADGAFKATVDLLLRAPDGSEAVTPLTLPAAPPAAGWAVQVVELPSS